MSYKIITPATVEPVTLAEARAHLRIEAFGSPLAHPDDDQVEMMLTSARQFCEEYTGLALSDQTIEFAYDEFPDGNIELPLTPCTAITSIKYFDVDDVETTLSNALYALDDYSKPNKIRLTLNSVWPSTNDDANNVKVRVEVGNAPANVPFPIKSAILLLLGNFYENRQQDQLGSGRNTFNSLPMGVLSLLQPYRLNLGL
jgi:uncharacterized phiE125 gp8 family phage protein